MSITRNRELSQFGSFLYINDTSQSISITEGASGLVGIGSTIPTAKLDVLGDINVSGVVTATSFYGEIMGSVSNSVNSEYSLVSGISTVSLGLSATSNINTSGIITASAYYLNNAPLVDPILQTWFVGAGSSIYRLSGNVGVGLSTPNEKLTVLGNVSAGQFISTVTSGTAPFVVLSDTQVTNLNASFLRGKTPPSGNIVGTTDTQTLTNKNLITPVISSISNTGTITLPTSSTTLVGRDTTDTLINKTISASSNTISGLTNSNLSGSAGITNANLANSTISGVSLGSNLASLTFSGYLTSTGSYNGSTATTVSVAGTSLNTAGSLVARDVNGDFTASTINCSYLTASFTVQAQDFNSTSDINLKTNVKTVENALETVNQLRGVSFDWKENGKSSYGIIAQELEQILPELVNTKENKSVNYNGIIGVLIESIKELSKEVEDLRRKVS